MPAGFSLVSRYICRQFLFWFVCALVLATGFILLAETVEMIRRLSRLPDATLYLAVKLSAMKMPETIQVLFHLTVLASAMFTFWRMTRSQEIVIVRAAGVSAWQFLLPIVLAAALIGVAKITVLNPIGAALYGHYRQLETEYLQGGTITSISRGGLWLRQRTPGGLAVVYAARAAPDQIRLINVIFLLFGPDETYAGRIDAEGATLLDGYWDIRGAWVSQGTAQPHFLEQYRLPSNLTEETILESFASPETMSFWSLPDFIATLESTGFSSLRHRLHYNAMLAQPALLAAMVLLAAVFTLRNTRRGGTWLAVSIGILTGFLMFVVNDLVMTLGLTETIPVMMAAWAPAGLALLIGLALLLHLEEA